MIDLNDQSAVEDYAYHQYQYTHSHSHNLSHSKNLYEEWIARWSELDVIPLEDLNTEYAKENEGDLLPSHAKSFAIIRSVSGITSFLSSSTLIWMILRSSKGLSTTQHRLLFGLCISDILSSLSSSTFNAMAPAEINYYVWNARGNEASCDTQGFFAVLGGTGGLFYNATLNLYFLAVVKYEKNEEYIRTKLEPFLHAFPILVALTHSAVLLSKHHFNAHGNVPCISVYHYPPHCFGYDVGEVREGFKIACGRGLDGAWISSLASMVLVIIPVIPMAVSLTMIHRVVRKQERKLARYGRGSLMSIRTHLRKSVIALSASVGGQDSSSCGTRRRSSLLGRIRLSIRSSIPTSAGIGGAKCTRSSICQSKRSNKTRSKSRAVMRKAIGYSFAWLLSFGAFLVGTAIDLIGGGGYPLMIGYIVNMFVPLQGLFNLLIFMYPKIMAARKIRRRGEKKISWFHAFSRAFWSTGNDRKNKGPIIPRKKSRSKLDSSKRKMTTSILRFKKHRNQKHGGHKEIQENDEGGKCEIQMPNNELSTTTQMHFSEQMEAVNVLEESCNIEGGEDSDALGNISEELNETMEWRQRHQKEEEKCEIETPHDEIAGVKSMKKTYTSYASNISHDKTLF